MALIDLELAPDANLLARFVAGRDQRAFAQLVARHGPMVMGVARRVLNNEEDAEEAFQATFLALAGAADKIRQQASVAAWLHQTTVRSAKSVRRMNAKWVRSVERKAEISGGTTSQYPDSLLDLRDVLDIELARLPPKLRAATVLCDLEGLSRNDAARRLGVPLNTLNNHLSESRKRLRYRLAKHGIGLAVTGLVAGMEQLAAASSTLPPTVVQQTTKKAMAFAAGKSATEIGTSAAVLKTASGIVAAMKLLKLATVSLVMLPLVATVVAVAAMLASLPMPNLGKASFVDSFDDGDATDGKPVVWRGIFDEATYDASSGDFVLSRPAGGDPAVAFAELSKPIADVSVRAQIKQLGNPGYYGVFVRANANAKTGYQAGIDTVANKAYIVRNEGGAAGRSFSQLASTPTKIDLSQHETVLHLEMIGDEIKFFVWRADDRKPDQPTLIVKDAMYATGLPAIAVDGGMDNSAAFRYVEVNEL